MTFVIPQIENVIFVVWSNSDKHKYEWASVPNDFISILISRREIIPKIFPPGGEEISQEQEDGVEDTEID